MDRRSTGGAFGAGGGEFGAGVLENWETSFRIFERIGGERVSEVKTARGPER